MVKGQPVFSTPKTEQGIRRIAVSPDVLEILAAHKQRQEAERAFLGVAWPETDLVFTSELGTPLHPRNFERTWYRLQAEAGVPQVRLHDLRHLHVSLLVKRGFDLRTIADRVGHTDPAFTLRRYSHLFEEQRQAAAVSLPDLLVGNGPRAVN
ncbi:MAG: site-specific integrase [Deinococcus sp.]|nr:site-specific integrase [Deinococcus sp.]